MVELGINQDGMLVITGPLEVPDVARVVRGPLMAFLVLSRTSNSIVFDSVNDVIAAVTYIRDAFYRENISLTLDGMLATMMSRRSVEQELIVNARNGDTSPISVPKIPGFKSDVELLPHQIRGVAKSLQIGNFAEFSVQGAGKTMIVLAIFAHLKANSEVEKLLVIGPASSFQPWEEEIERCFSERLTVLRWSGAMSRRTRMVPQYARADAVLCSYDTARRDVQMLSDQLKAAPSLMVLDESHYIKNFDVGARGAATLKLAPHAAKRLILSGTPAPHSLLDLYTQFSFLWPASKSDVIGSPRKFLDVVENSDKPAAELRHQLSPFFHRTTQRELGLPDPKFHTEVIPMDGIPPGQMRILRSLENKVSVETRLLPTMSDRKLVAQWRRARIIRLLQAASNPALLSTANEVPDDPRVAFDVSELATIVSDFRDGKVLSAKTAWTIEKTVSLINAGHKVLIWTWWVANIRMLADIFKNYEPLLLFGDIKPYEVIDDSDEISREKNIREFKTRDDRPLLIANPAACAESISLHQVCHHAIYADRTYNCGQFLQSLNRIHRIGLTADAETHYWLPTLDCAIERSVDRRLRRRQIDMNEFLGDDTPVRGPAWIVDDVATESDDETNEAFEDLLTELP